MDYKLRQFIDNVTKKKYYRSGDRTFEVVDDAFNPSNVTTSDFVQQSTKERIYIPGQKTIDGKRHVRFVYSKYCEIRLKVHKFIY